MDEQRVKRVLRELIDALVDEDNKVIQGKIFTFTVTGSEDGDLGDWEVSVQPTRYPPGRRADMKH